MIKDRYDLPMTTNSSKAAEHYVEGLDLYLSWNYGSGENYKKAVEADEEFALAHAAVSLVELAEGNTGRATNSINRALSLSKNASPREKQHIRAIDLQVRGDGRGFYTLAREHLAEYPRDVFILLQAHEFIFLGCSTSGITSYPQEMLSMYDSVKSHYGDDWAFLAPYSFAHHENGLLDTALRLAERSLHLHPDNAQASHSVAHCFLEMGEAKDGCDFLGDWTGRYDKRAPFYVHLAWHLALFELALGRYPRVQTLYEDEIRPSVLDKDGFTLEDSASLLWRCQLYGLSVSMKDWSEVRCQAGDATEGTGTVYRDAHAALAFAGSGDKEAHKALAKRLTELSSRGDKLTQEVTLPLVRGLEAFAEGSYDGAIELMEPIFSKPDFYQMVRIGGSHAQREVFEDTLLETYLRARKFDKAEEMLRSRLKNRPSTRDTFWMARVQVGKGQLDAARVNIGAVKQEWKSADTDSPELIALNRLAEKTG